MPTLMDLRVEGLDDFVAKTKRLGDRKQQQRVLKPTVRAATNPAKTALRREIRQRAKRTGSTAKAVASTLRVYSSGQVVAVIGMRKGKSFETEYGKVVPGNIFHLASEGTRPHQTHSEPRRVFIGGRWVTLHQVNHPGAQRKDLLRTAVRKAMPQVRGAMAKTFERTLTRELLKRR